MRPFLLALLLASAPAAAFGKGHTLTAKVWQKKTSFAKTMTLTAGSQDNFVGTVKGSDGKTRCQMILNVLLNKLKGKPGVYSLMYQFELSKGEMASGRTFQVQGGLLMRPGDRVITLLCGDWALRFDLDRHGKKKTPSSAGLANYRVTMELDWADTKRVCKYVGELGNQANIIDAFRQSAKKSSFTFNTLLTKKKKGFNLQFQLSDTPPGGGRTLTLQKDQFLTPGKKVVYKTKGYRMSLLLDKP